MSDAELQSLLADGPEQPTGAPEDQQENATNTKIEKVFAMFKTYLDAKIDEKGKRIELKGKTEKEVVQLTYKGNPKQYELNAKIDAILDEIAKSNSRAGQNARITTLVEEARALIKRRQKLIKIAERNKDGWKIVEEYESDDLTSNSEDEKRLKRAKDAVVEMLVNTIDATNVVDKDTGPKNAEQGGQKVSISITPNLAAHTKTLQIKESPMSDNVE